MSLDQEKQSARFFTRYRVILIITFILVLVWAVLNFTHGHPVYAVLIIAFYIISLVLPKPSFTLVLVIVAAYIVINSTVIASLEGVQKASNSAVKQPGQALSNLFTPNSGLDVLPDKAQQVLTLIQENDITSYRLSTVISEDYHLMQRIVESAWPVRMAEDSVHVFITPDESPDYGKCTVTDQVEEVILVHCP